MKTKEIEKLLEKYYKGESSEEEELILRRFFESEDVPSGFETEKTLFRYFSENESVPDPSEKFEDKIISAIDSIERRKPLIALSSKVLFYSSIAAGLFLIIASYFLFMHRNEPKDTFSSPEVAYTEAVKVLYEVSSTFNRGTLHLDQIRKLEDKAAKGFSEIDRSSRMLDKNLKNLDYFKQAIKMATSPMDIIKNK